MFLRLSGCNLHCSWCDTPYTWDWKGVNGTSYNIHEQTHIYTADETRRMIEERSDDKADLLVITGGEPLLQQKALVPLIASLLSGSDIRIEIETNGTVEPYHLNPNAFFEGGNRVLFNVSPKLVNSGNEVAKAIPLASMNYFAADRRARFKFVVNSDQDTAWNEIDNIRQAFGIAKKRIWIMPQGTNAIELAYAQGPIAQRALIEGYNFTGRLHVALWGNTRGK